MKSARVLSSIAIGAALAAACGGVSTVGNQLAGGDGGPTEESESGAEPRSDATAAQPDAGTPGTPAINVSCQGAQSCPRSQVCCASLSLSGIDVACANACAGGSFQVCQTNAECTTSGEVCAASPLGTGGVCTAARDAGLRGPIDSGAVEDGNAHDSSVAADGNAPDSSVAADGNAPDSSDVADSNAHDAEIVVDASVAVEAASGNDAASDGGGGDGQGLSGDDGAADDDSSDGGGS
jgi:hypothetical protein